MIVLYLYLYLTILRNKNDNEQVNWYEYLKGCYHWLPLNWLSTLNNRLKVFMFTGVLVTKLNFRNYKIKPFRCLNRIEVSGVGFRAPQTPPPPPPPSPPPSPHCWDMGPGDTGPELEQVRVRSSVGPQVNPDNSDSDVPHHPDQQNRTRQKKFAKNFKGLPVEETVHKSNYCCFVTLVTKLNMIGYACALVGDILLQGHLYVTENYLGFHSNVFGYVTRVCFVIIIESVYQWLI